MADLAHLPARPTASASDALTVSGLTHRIGERVVLQDVALTVPACNRAPVPFTPGLGEIMTLTQMRHVKLWFAGDAANWPLAKY